MNPRKNIFTFIVAISVLVFALLQTSCILVPPPENKYKRFEGKEVILKENHSLYEVSGRNLARTDKLYLVSYPGLYGDLRSWQLRAGTTVFIDDIKHIRTLPFDGWVVLGHVEVGGKRRDFEFNSSSSLWKLSDGN